MYCGNCGKEVNESAKFCKNCGEKIILEEVEDLQEKVEAEEVAEETEVTETTEEYEYTLEGVEDGSLLEKEPVTRDDKKTNIFKHPIFKDKKKLGAIVAIIAVLVSGLYYYIDNNRKIENMINEINTIESRFGEYILTDETQKNYNNISKEIDNLGENRDLNYIKAIYEKMKVFEAQVIKDNNSLLQESLKNTSERDFSRAYEDEIKKLNEYKTNLESLIKDKKFVSAKAKLEEWNKLLDEINVEYDNYEVIVNQIDFSEYPKIKTYVEIRDRITGEVPKNLDPRFFYISEKTLNDPKLLRKTVLKASQLDQIEKLNINMVADISGSMIGYPLESAKSIMSNFINQVQFSIGDTVELTGFSDGVYTFKPFTNNAEELQTEINNLYTGDMTALYDALFASVNTTAVQSGAKCVIAFTDGMDNYSNCTPEDVINASKRYNVPVFIVGVGDSLDSSELRRIAEETGGTYYNVYDFEDMGSLYDDIYRQQKQLYLVEYETDIPPSNASDRMLEVNVQTRESGGKTAHQFRPAILGGTQSQLNYEDEIDKLIAAYLTNYVHAINNHDYSYISDYIIPGSSIENQLKPYIMKDIKEKLLSFEILEKNFKDENTCVVSVRETYDIQNYQEPLHMRTLEGKLKVVKDKNGKWKLYDFGAKYKIISKINY